jgi:hypothetical protein
MLERMLTQVEAEVRAAVGRAGPAGGVREKPEQAL